jgi:hypothetical protein
VSDAVTGRIPRVGGPAQRVCVFGKLGADSRVEVARIVEQADRLAAGRVPDVG